jgi:hypothetical protein
LRNLPAPLREPVMHQIARELYSLPELMTA